MNQGTSVRFRVIVFALTAGMIAFAFIHSAMPASESSKESNSVLAFLSALLSGLGIHRELTGLFVRKLAHFSEYTVIGTLLVSCAYSFDRARPYLIRSNELFRFYTISCSNNYYEENESRGSNRKQNGQ